MQTTLRERERHRYSLLTNARVNAKEIYLIPLCELLLWHIEKELQLGRHCELLSGEGDFLWRHHIACFSYSILDSQGSQFINFLSEFICPPSGYSRINKHSKYWKTSPSTSNKIQHLSESACRNPSVTTMYTSVPLSRKISAVIAYVLPTPLLVSTSALSLSFKF